MNLLSPAALQVPLLPRLKLSPDWGTVLNALDSPLFESHLGEGHPPHVALANAVDSAGDATPAHL